MGVRATPEYLSKLNVNLTDWQWAQVCVGQTPDSIPEYLIVRKVEFVRERVYPLRDQVLHDYRVHFRGGTYDCVSISPMMSRPEVGRYYPRSPLASGDFVSWDEDEG